MLVQLVHIAQRSTRLVERALRCTLLRPGTGGAPRAPSSSRMRVEHTAAGGSGGRPAGTTHIAERRQSGRPEASAAQKRARTVSRTRAGVRGGEPRRAVEQQDRAQGRVIEPQQRTAGDAHHSGRPINVPYILRIWRFRDGEHRTILFHRLHRWWSARIRAAGKEGQDERMLARRLAPGSIRSPRIHTHSRRAAGPPRTAGARLGRPGRLS